MKKISYFLFICILTCKSLSGQSFQWVNSGGGSDTDEAYCVALDISGNVHITGLYSTPATIGGTVLSGTGLTNIFAAKYNTGGGNVWIEDGGGPGYSGGHVLAVDNADNVYVTGEFESSVTIGTVTLTSSGLRDIFVAKYNSTGILQWAKKFGGSGDEGANSIRTDAAGDFYITGHFEDTAYFDAQQVVSSGGEDVFVVKCNSSGTILWLTAAGGPFDDSGRGLAIDNGNVCITGSFSDTALFGFTALMSVNSLTDIFIARLNSSGIFQWAKSAGSTGVEVAYDAGFDASGNCYITGMFQNTATFGAAQVISNGGDEIFAAKYDVAGNAQWVIGAGGSSKDKAYSIAVDPSGTFFITGSFEDTASFGTQQLISAGDKDVFVACYNSSGVFQWVMQGGGPGLDRGYGIAYNNIGSLYVTGIFEQTATFGTSQVTSAGGRDLFLAKINTITGINETSSLQNNLKVFPNPAKNLIQIESPDNTVLPQQLRIYNTLGEIIFSKSISKNHEVIDISEFTAGLYLVRMDTGYVRMVKE